MDESNNIRADILLGVKGESEAIKFLDNIQSRVNELYTSSSKNLQSTLKQVAEQAEGRVSLAQRPQDVRQKLATHLNDVIRGSEAAIADIQKSASYSKLEKSYTELISPDFEKLSHKEKQALINRVIKDAVKFIETFITQWDKSTYDAITMARMKETHPNLYEKIVAPYFGTPQEVEKTMEFMRAIPRRAGKEFLDAVKQDIGNVERELQRPLNRLPAYTLTAIYAGLSSARQVSDYFASEQTAFSLASPEAMYQARRQWEIQRTRLTGNVGGAIGGLGIAGIIAAIAAAAGAPFTGGASLMLATGGMYAGTQIGGGIAEWFAKGQEAEMNVNTALMGETRRAVEGTYYPYLIAERNMRQRFGVSPSLKGLGYGGFPMTQGIAEGLGYTAEEQLKLGYQYGAMGYYNREGFQQTLGWGRLRGINEHALALNRIGMYLGRGVSIPEFGGIDRLVRMMGMDPDEFPRMPQMMEHVMGMGEMLAARGGVTPDWWKRTMELSAIPIAMFGKEFYGDPTLGGRQTFQAMQGMFQPKTQAGQWLLMSAMGLGRLPLEEVMEKASLGLVSPLTSVEDITNLINYGRKFTPYKSTRAIREFFLKGQFNLENVPIETLDKLIERSKELADDPLTRVKMQEALDEAKKYIPAEDFYKKAISDKGIITVAETKKEEMDVWLRSMGEETESITRKGDIVRVKGIAMAATTDKFLDTLDKIFSESTEKMMEIISKYYKKDVKILLPDEDIDQKRFPPYIIQLPFGVVSKDGNK